MRGRLIYVMGPSGAGKDTVLQGVLRLMGDRACLAPRVVTRQAVPAEQGCLPVTEQEFIDMECAGLLAMSWRANGLAYGILHHVDARLAAGQDVFINGSRAYLPMALTRYADLVPVMLRVRPRLLQERLLRRGRESMTQIQARLLRNLTVSAVTDSMSRQMLWIDNSGSPDEAVQTLYQGLLEWPSSI